MSYAGVVHVETGAMWHGVFVQQMRCPVHAATGKASHD